MSLEEYTPEALAQALSTENAELRELLTAVARDLERLAATRGYHDQESRVMLGRAMRIRRQLLEA